MEPQIETDQKSVNSQEDDEEDEIAPRRPMRLASESEKQKEHLNIVFIGHVGKCPETFLPLVTQMIKPCFELVYLSDE